MPTIALLTDFGTKDWYVGAVKGVLRRRCPAAQLIDITHEIPRQDLLAGAFTLAAAVPWFPEGTVFLAVVDPGVGGDRPLVAAAADRRYFVGPDNGVLSLSLQHARHRQIVRLTQRRYWVRQVSSTFHGRDIMAPVAAYLACGGSLRRLGPVQPRVRPLVMPPLRRQSGQWVGSIIHIDAFGNLITNLPSALLETRRQRLTMWVRYKGRRARVVSSYGDGGARGIVAVVGSVGLIELAIFKRSAAKVLRARRGERVQLITR